MPVEKHKNTVVHKNKIKSHKNSTDSAYLCLQVSAFVFNGFAISFQMLQGTKFSIKHTERKTKMKFFMVIKLDVSKVCT